MNCAQPPAWPITRNRKKIRAFTNVGKLRCVDAIAGVAPVATKLPLAPAPYDACRDRHVPWSREAR
jgi:hypothetical protein